MQEASGRSHQQPVLERSSLKEQATLLRQVVGLKKQPICTPSFEVTQNPGATPLLLFALLLFALPLLLTYATLLVLFSCGVTEDRIIA